VGITQAKEGLPVALVNIHLVLAVILVAAITAQLLSQRGPEQEAVEPEQEVLEVKKV
jgi:cytochrome c oxidase assembly protein subunit 15